MLKIVTSLHTLFSYAHKEGQARLTYNNNPTPENLNILNKAIDNHEQYRQICLKSDEMIGMPYIGDII